MRKSNKSERGEGQKRIIFTGQSGLNTKQCLRDFIQFISDHSTLVNHSGNPPLFIDFEEQMVKIEEERRQIEISTERFFSEVLTLPAPRFNAVWKEAMKRVIVISEEAKKNQQDIYLKMHASFYNPETREYSCPVSIDEFRNFNPNKIVTLIDDIYDIHLRLREPEQIFGASGLEQESPLEEVFHLFRILDWRSKEISLARHLAKEASQAEHYVFATKHSYLTLYNLIHKNFLKVYISHPITEVRRLQNTGKLDDARRIIKSIEDLETISADKFVSFLPTTIDELRILSRESDGKKIFLPRLMERWNESRFEDDSRIFFKKSSSLSKSQFWNALVTDESSSIESSVTLDVLARQILHQITTRDYKLVEQSAALLVYRPCFNGNSSEGVRREIEYHLKLKEFVSRKPCYVYLPKVDQDRFFVRLLEDALEKETYISFLLNAREKGRDVSSVNKNTFSLTFTEQDSTVLTSSLATYPDDIYSKLKGILSSHNHPLYSEDGAMRGEKRYEEWRSLKEIVERVLAKYHSDLELYKQEEFKVVENNGLTEKEIIEDAYKYFQSVS
jgi:hypothetical protein